MFKLNDIIVPVQRYDTGFYEYGRVVGWDQNSYETEREILYDIQWFDRNGRAHSVSRHPSYMLKIEESEIPL